MQELIQPIRQEARRLLEGGLVDVILGFTAGTLPMRVAPLMATQLDEVERLTWGSFCENNLARYLRGLRGKRVAVVAKGCDARSIVALITERQLERDKLYIIGIPCGGMLDRRIIARRAPGEVLAVREDGEEVVVEGRGFSVRLPRSGVLYRSCAACLHPNPVLYDTLLGEAVPVSNEDPFAHVRQMEQKSAEERARYFASEAQRCIRCYACRQACPMCYCEECFVDHTTPRWIESGVTPAGVQGWQIGRAYHLTGRCVDCGACERACPVEIDLVYLNGKLNKDVRELYGFEPGAKAGDLPPLAVFRPDEGPDF